MWVYSQFEMQGPGKPPRRLDVLATHPRPDGSPILEGPGNEEFVCGKCFRRLVVGGERDHLSYYRLTCPDCGAVNAVP